MESKWLRYLIDTLEEEIVRGSIPCALVIEFGHIALPLVEANIDWARKNVLFAEKLCKLLTKRFGKQLRLLPCVLINDLGSIGAERIPIEFEELFYTNRILTFDKLNTFSERNMRNRASRKLGKLFREQAGGNSSFDRFQFDSCAVPAGNVKSSGIIIPRCISILSAFIDRTFELAQQRLHNQFSPSVIFLSFASNEREYHQTIDGVHLFFRGWSQSAPSNLTAIIVQWVPWIRQEVIVIDSAPRTLALLTSYRAGSDIVEADIIKVENIEKGIYALDCQNLECPLPVQRTAQAILRIEPGQFLLVATTDPMSLIDICAWVAKSEHNLIHVSEDQEKFIFHIQRVK